jgi:serine/threonine protein kinase/tetratricopeptide (TPR) repeat protein
LNDPDVRFCASCGASTDEGRPDPLIGRTVGGAYLLQELIGVGGMGRVYRAEQNMLGRTVAVKVIHPHLLGDDQTVARFYNEARAASRLNHPASVSIIDFGRTEDGILYLVMEHLAGKDLAHVLAEEGPLPFVRVCRVLRHVLSALGEAHALGVVHRDLTPENVIVRRARRGAEQIKVVDFGLAHIVGPGGTSITTPGLVCGTPDYMAPEQGRGETVDGRGDLYAVGVVLFEMLTDRLPFEGDTPTKVVFKHIHEAIPDPRAIAPHRAIPDDLVEVCLKSLQKRPEARYQSADEFYEALRKIEARLETVRSASVTACGTCGAQNPNDQRFCGSCGARMTDRFTIPPSFRSAAPGKSTKPALGQTSMIGRAVEIEQLLELHQRSRNAGVCVRLIGEAGVGKTRLLEELGAQIESHGDLVVRAGPHPSSGPVPYWPIRQMVRTLLDVDDARLAQIAAGGMIGDPIARAGLAELLDPKGLEGRPGESRAEAVSVALATAIRVAQARARSGMVTLIVDDLWRCDALSTEVLQRLIDRMHEGPLFLAVATIPQRDVLRGDESVKMQIRGLELREAGLVLAGETDADDREALRDFDTAPATRLLLPLYLEQLRALGVHGLEGDETLPPRLADAVVARLERLDVSARRLIQVIAVLGDETSLEYVRELSRGSDMGAVDSLTRERLIKITGDRVALCHPFVRELVESSIPAEHRKELHTHALQVTAASGAPLEVRAEHAFRAAEPMSALLLLERMGDAAMKRGDGSAAVLAFRRGLEVARRELLVTGETALDRAIVTFSRKLGDAMDLAGDSAGADGVLREALELAGPANRERARMLLLLSRVAARRNRQRDATRLLGQALELSARQNDRIGEAEAHVALGKLRLADGDTLTAANTLKTAVELLRGQKGAESLAVEGSLARAEALRAIGDPEAASQELEHARAAAEKSGANVLLASVIAAMAAAAEASGDRQRAAAQYREAARLAETAGDAERSRKWEHLGRVSEARQVG